MNPFVDDGRPFRRNEAGATVIEYLVLVAVVGLLMLSDSMHVAEALRSALYGVAGHVLSGIL